MRPQNAPDEALAQVRAWLAEYPTLGLEYLTKADWIAFKLQVSKTQAKRWIYWATR
jgi:hypothetical protein